MQQSQLIGKPGKRTVMAVVVLAVVVAVAGWLVFLGAFPAPDRWVFGAAWVLANAASAGYFVRTYRRRTGIFTGDSR